MNEHPDRALSYARNFAISLWERHYKATAPNWKPLDDVLGILTQIDNMVAAAPAPAIPEGWRLLKDTTHDERSWHEDSGHENGNYSNQCHYCLRMFTGHKRRVTCKVCAAAPAPAIPEGFVLVPKEPDTRMCEACLKEARFQFGHGITIDAAVHLYRAMIATAQAQPAPDNGGKTGWPLGMLQDDSRVVPDEHHREGTSMTVMQDHLFARLQDALPLIGPDHDTLVARKDQP